MLKKLFALVAILSFVAFTVPGYSQSKCEKPAGDSLKKSIFQDISDNIEKVGQEALGEKKPLTGVFQSSHDYIIESSPKAKCLSLRNNENELKRRRGIKD